MTGSERTLDHTSFSELYWRRDPLLINLYTLPPGFLRISHLLSGELVEIIEDVHALQVISEMYCEPAPFDVFSTMQIDNQQAWNESRIEAFKIRDNPVLESCCLTLYLCTYLSCTTVWQSVLIPVSHWHLLILCMAQADRKNQSHLSSKILKVLQESELTSLWDPYVDLFIWILYMGGAFAQSVTRDEYWTLLRQTYSKRLKHRYSSWAELHKILCEYIWCEATFARAVRNFWEEGVVCGPVTGNTPEVVDT